MWGRPKEETVCLSLEVGSSNSEVSGPILSKSEESKKQKARSPTTYIA